MNNNDIANLISIVENQDKETRKIMKKTKSNMVTYSFATDDSRFFEIKIVEKKKKTYVFPAEIGSDEYLDNVNNADITI